MHEVCVDCTHALHCPLDDPAIEQGRRDGWAATIIALEAEAAS
jgi:hypothetical protein